MEILIIIACSIVSSGFFTASVQGNDTFREIFVGTGLLACISTGVALFIYSIWDNYIACSSIGLMIGGMGPNTAKKYANKILNNIGKNKS